MKQGKIHKGFLLIAIALSTQITISAVLLNARPVYATGLTTVRNGIAIHSNTEFTAANGVVSGSGSMTDPYLIANWDIELPTAAVQVVFSDGPLLAGILIANTTAHVTLRNIQVHSPYPGWWIDKGIVLWNTTNVSVETSRVWNGNNGVLLLGASNTKIMSNEFYNLIQAVEIAGGFPLKTSIATGNMVFGNNIHDTNGIGMSLVSASDNLISNNSISNMAEWAALLDRGSARNIFSDNHISNSTVGIEAVFSSVNNTISGNFFDVNVLGVGVGFGANGTIVSSNEIHSLRWGINLIEVSGSKISQNIVHATEVGVNLLQAARANAVTGNIVTSHIGLFFCGTEIGFNRIAPPPNDLRASNRPIQHCQ